MQSVCKYFDRQNVGCSRSCYNESMVVAFRKTKHCIQS